MLKFMFVGHRKAGVTREEYFDWWAADRHVSLVRQFPGLKRWVQNRVKDDADGDGPDSVGEVWFESAEAFERTMASEAWAAAFEDGKPYADIEKCYGFVVDEETIIE
jgi:uncharacterized protein (TIGR02118 family)